MIYILTHKKFEKPLGTEEYAVMQVGASNNKKLGYLCDDIDDNISKLNPFFCELTGMYWLWKNVQEKYVGICHYRRFFVKGKKVLQENELNTILNGCDAIVPQKDKFPISVYKQYQYSNQHNIEDLDKLIKIIEEKYPEYIDALNKVLNEKFFLPFNMMYMKKELFDKYCEWLFDILFELEKEIPYKEYQGQKKRVFGYLSERMFLVWLEKNKINYKGVKVYNFEGEISISEKIFTRINIFLYIHFGLDLRK